ncbi:AAA domain-containing protein, putative AbiEii toxin, Type IV TA system [Microbacterium azadirachtae]|uniref:AAA domain-containing protein, putative AbiEii toxin, Type IV TA system n=1 Tax=Microbacterium azadirachtae TaxID=582680 RepID=A0A1I6IZK5_9MICO|nr:AAA domain-containing protein, putative AbiEii toxin, Type IV TA system [Microbacterium azadirachtae]
MNGSGKSHLLESIDNFSTQWPGIHDGSRRPKLLTTASLQQVDALLSTSETREQKVSRFQQQVSALVDAYRGRPQFEDELRARIVGDGVLTAAALEHAERAAERPVFEWTPQDFGRYTPRELGHLDLFAVLVADVFHNYSYLQTMNSFRRWMSETQSQDAAWLSPDDFTTLYGPPPWITLNEVLADVELNYRYATPEPTTTELVTAVPRLIDEGSGFEVAPSNLSTGEKTLLTIALSAYSATSRRDGVALPTVVLLDEPDAALHPRMIASLLRLVQTQLVKELGVPVIMTSHSPTTVALAPEESLYIMRRSGEPRLVKASKDLSLKSLLVGVPTVSIVAENRRIVIVESPNDERIYTHAAAVLGTTVSTDRSLQFMAAGSVNLPNGSAAVIDLVSRLRSNGNSQVWGLIDRDYANSSPHPAVAFDASRHSIENLFLDPLALAILLVRDGEQRALAAAQQRYTGLQFDSAQTLVDWVTKEIAVGGDDPDVEAAAYLGGSVMVRKFWSELRGHDLHERILTRFPSLRSHRNRLLDDVAQHVWADHPWCVPMPFIETLRRLADD